MNSYSIRARLLFGAALVLVAFLAAAGFAVNRAHADSVRAAHFSRMQGTVYLLLARAELDGQGELVLPPDVGEPRLAVPASGMYAGIHNLARKEQWRSASVLGTDPPLRRDGVETGEWLNEVVTHGGRDYLAVSFGVKWETGKRAAPLVITVAEDASEYEREVAIFARTLWAWLGGATVLLLLAQVLLLEWALVPLKRVAIEIGRIEAGTQSRIEGSYPTEISGLTDNLNTLVAQERDRQGRYKEALSFLAHSLKTPLAVLRNALQSPQDLPVAVRQQVKRMDEIVQHQLGRAAAGGASRFSTPLPLAPVLARVRDALQKVYAEKELQFTVHCPADLAWRIDEGDLFEVMGNVMDNAAKWAKSQVAASAMRDGGRLVIEVQDDGPGFSDTESVLHMHVRGDERVPGHGVGLAVVNDIVRSYQGKLKLGRSGMGGGSVRIELPAS
ncbi:MAG: histidine kinase [Burkholderiales bacterium]|nr:histidine kinase [Burkholderiales bacterium]